MRGGVTEELGGQRLKKLVWKLYSKDILCLRTFQKYCFLPVPPNPIFSVFIMVIQDMDHAILAQLSLDSETFPHQYFLHQQVFETDVMLPMTLEQ